MKRIAQAMFVLENLTGIRERREIRRRTREEVRQLKENVKRACGNPR